MPELAFAIHAHFYQPPREDPLTGVIPDEAGATPYSNWNQRIFAECYRPNALLGNFQHISFNIGPTLFSWMEGHDASLCRSIVAQERANFDAYGSSNALAQPYNHTILPLASHEDKVTQVAWGVADFEHRFGHKPQGMWLPETAVDRETLSVLAEAGIEFTILAPWQVQGHPSGASQPFRVELAGGRVIKVFLYHAELSGGVSFNPELTINADRFATEQLRPRYKSDSIEDDSPQLILIATDGELYGHHQRQREQFLAHLVNSASTSAGLRATYPGMWLRCYPPRTTIEIRDKTSWSCHHGVARWTGECECTPGDRNWKTNMRSTFDRLAAEIDRIYVEFTRSQIHDPWALRNKYIHVLLGHISIDELIYQEAGVHLPDEMRLKIHLLLEAQYARQRMYTSCGWFFDDFDRIEPQNNVVSAVQAVRLVRAATGINLDVTALVGLSQVKSDRSGLKGDAVFQYHLKRDVPDAWWLDTDAPA